MERKCVGDCEGLTFWLAQPEDYQEVMSMSEGIYGGNDYLPHRYHEWLEEPGRTVLLGRSSQGKLVALESSMVVDEGTTVVVEGLRHAPQPGVAVWLASYRGLLTVISAFGLVETINSRVNRWSRP